jgi:hypothetical protein
MVPILHLKILYPFSQKNLNQLRVSSMCVYRVRFQNASRSLSSKNLMQYTTKSQKDAHYISIAPRFLHENDREAFCISENFPYIVYLYSQKIDHCVLRYTRQKLKYFDRKFRMTSFLMLVICLIRNYESTSWKIYFIVYLMLSMFHIKIIFICNNIFDTVHDQ